MNLRLFINQNFYQTDIDWNFVEEFLKSFKAVTTMTDLLSDDFLKIYFEIIFTIKIEANNSQLSKLLFTLLNKTVAAAIYLDPRLHILLRSPDFVNLMPVTPAHLKTFPTKIKSISQKDSQDHSENYGILYSSASIPDSEGLLDAYLNEICATQGIHFTNLCEITDTKINLAEFWETRMHGCHFGTIVPKLVHLV